MPLKMVNNAKKIIFHGRIYFDYNSYNSALRCLLIKNSDGKINEMFSQIKLEKL